MRPSAWKLQFVVEVVWIVGLQVDVQVAHECRATASELPLKCTRLLAFASHVPWALDQNPPCRSCTCFGTVAILGCGTLTCTVSGPLVLVVDILEDLEVAP